MENGAAQESLSLTAQNLRAAKRRISPAVTKLELLGISVFLAPGLSGRGYAQIPTHMTPVEKHALFLLARGLKGRPAAAAEIGSFLGASACYLAAGIGGRGRVYCVDTWNNEAMDEPERDTYADFIRNTSGLGLSIVTLRGRSVEIARQFQQKIDMLFIDGDHSYDACLADWLSWSPFLNHHAVVVFHDSGWAEGVNKVIQDEVLPRTRREARLENMFVAWF